MYVNKMVWVVLVFVVFFTLLQSEAGKAQVLEIKNCVLYKSQGNIKFKFGIELNKVQKLKQYLSEGSPLKMICNLRLFKERPFWIDKELKKRKLSYELNNNPLTQKYILTNLVNKNSIKGKNLNKLLNARWKELELFLGKWDALPRDKDYTIEIEVLLKRGKVPGWLKMVSFFWSWEELSSEVYEINFTY